jgi:hypothetical protein
LKHLRPRKKQPELLSPLLKEVRDLFSGFRFVLLIRNTQKIKCTCYNDLERSYDSGHDVCLGTGWIPTIEKHRSWYQMASVPQSLPRVIEVLEPAATAINAKFFYFFRSAHVEVGDEIVITEFGEDGLPVFQTAEFYTANHPEPKYDETGELIFWKVACERSIAESESRSMALYQIRDSIKEIPLI